MVYHNFAISPKFENQNFPKFVVQNGRTSVTRFFQNFEVDIKIPKSPKIGFITKILKKILKTCIVDSELGEFGGLNPNLHRTLLVRRKNVLQIQLDARKGTQIRFFNT